MDWSIRNNTLFCSIFTNCKANSCLTCGSTLHSTSFCPTLVNQPSGVPTSTSGSSYVTRSSFSGVQPVSRSNATNDKLGRERVMYQGQEICNNFNSIRGCHWVTCKNAHVCLLCKQSNHPRTRCNLSKNLQGQKIPVVR